MTEAEWDANDSLWNVSGSDLSELFKESPSKFFHFLAALLPRFLPRDGCEICLDSLSLFERQVHQGWSTEGWWSVIRATHPAMTCNSRGWFRYTVHYLNGDLTQAELWNRLLDVACHINYLGQLHCLRSGDTNGILSLAEQQKESLREGARIAKEVLGNPFRAPTLDAFWLSWNGGCIPKFAQVIYEERRFEDMPILGDALEEAGCENIDILNHCRQPENHLRGCWVIDLLLRRS